MEKAAVLNQRVAELEMKVIQCQEIEGSLRMKERTQQALLNASTETAMQVDLESNILALNNVAAQKLGKNQLASRINWEEDGPTIIFILFDTWNSS